MAWSIAQLLSRFKGELLDEVSQEVVAQPLHGLADLESATPGSIAFLAHPKYLKHSYTTQASLILVPHALVFQQPLLPLRMAVDDPYGCFVLLMQEHHQKKHPPFNHTEQPAYLGKNVQLGKNIYRAAFSYIADGAIIGDDVQIYPHVYIGQFASIGQGTLLHSGVKIAPYTQIGARCTIHSAAVIGGAGFGFHQREDGAYERVPSLGHVVLEDDVEVGAHTAIDAATLQETRIAQGCKIDNLVQIAHNVHLGKHTAMAAQSAIAGSTHLGSHCKIGGQAGVAGHLRLGDKTVVLGQAGVTRSFKEGSITLAGMPAFDHQQFWHCYAKFKKMALENEIN